MINKDSDQENEDNDNQNFLGSDPGPSITKALKNGALNNKEFDTGVPSFKKA